MNALSDTQRRSDFGVGLRSARIAAGFRHATELAGRLQVSEQTVNRWERSERRPQRSIRLELADALAMTLSDLDGILETRTPSVGRRASPRLAVVAALRSDREENAAGQPVVASSAPQRSLDAAAQPGWSQSDQDAEPPETDRTSQANDHDLTPNLENLRASFLNTVIEVGLGQGRAESRTWVATARATAIMLGLPWREEYEEADDR